MKIAIQEIPFEGLAFSFHNRDWLPEEVEAGGEVRANLELCRNGARIMVVGSLDVNIHQECDRCLADFSLPLATDFRLDFELDSQEPIGKEHSCRSEEMETEFLQESEIDLHDLLQQQLYLALPVKVLCKEDCKGLCSGCGSDLNRVECSCQQEGSSAFGVLRTLLK